MVDKKLVDEFIKSTKGKKTHDRETENEKINRYMERLNLTRDEAINLIEWDKNETNKLDEIEKAKKVEYLKRKIDEQEKEPQQKSKISDDEVEKLYNKIVELSKKEPYKPFNDWFTSKQLAPHVADFLGARQIRFRLDKLEQQKLILVKATKPKTYKLVN